MEMMMKNELIDLAREAGLCWQSDGRPMIDIDRLEAFAKLVDAKATAKEREACAMLCEAEWSTVDQQAHSYDLAEAIRARGEA